MMVTMRSAGTSKLPVRKRVIEQHYSIRNINFLIRTKCTTTFLQNSKIYAVYVRNRKVAHELKKLNHFGSCPVTVSHM